MWSVGENRSAPQSPTWNAERTASLLPALEASVPVTAIDPQLVGSTVK